MGDVNINLNHHQLIGISANTNSSPFEPRLPYTTPRSSLMSINNCESPTLAVLLAMSTVTPLTSHEYSLSSKEVLSPLLPIRKKISLYAFIMLAGSPRLRPVREEVCGWRV